MSTILNKIITHKVSEVIQAKDTTPLAELKQKIFEAPETRSLKAALSVPGLAIIAELKKASPSAGIIRDPFVIEEIATSYIEAGANALSVLTDAHFFQGSLSYLKTLRQISPIPLLRKDFIIDDYQVYEARANHADAILLIVAALEEEKLKHLLQLCYDLGMEALVEVHNDQEMETALRCEAPIIGVNNRDLKTFHIDLSTTEQLAKQVPQNGYLVAESGLKTGADGYRMLQAGAEAVLIGSHFMQQSNPGAALLQFKRELSQCG